MNEAKELLQELWSRGVQLRVVEGGLQAKPSNLVTEDHRRRLAEHKQDLIRALTAGNGLLDEDSLREIRRLAQHIGSIVHYSGGQGLLIGLYRDRAVVDVGKVILTLNHTHVFTTGVLGGSSPGA